MRLGDDPKDKFNAGCPTPEEMFEDDLKEFVASISSQEHKSMVAMSHGRHLDDVVPHTQLPDWPNLQEVTAIFGRLGPWGSVSVEKWKKEVSPNSSLKPVYYVVEGLPKRTPDIGQFVSPWLDLFPMADEDFERKSGFTLTEYATLDPQYLVNCFVVCAVWNGQGETHSPNVFLVHPPKESTLENLKNFFEAKQEDPRSFHPPGHNFQPSSLGLGTVPKISALFCLTTAGK